MDIKYLKDGKIKIEGNYKGEEITKEFINEVEFQKFIKTL